MCQILAFVDQCGIPNQAGGADIGYEIEHENITTWPTLGTDGTYTGSFTLKTAKVWKKVNYVPGSSMIKNVLEGEPGAQGFHSECGYSIAGMSAAQKAAYQSRVNTAMVLVIPDKSGVLHVIGDPNNPAYMQPGDGIGTGEKAGDLRGAKIAYKANMGHISYTLDPAVALVLV